MPPRRQEEKYFVELGSIFPKGPYLAAWDCVGAGGLRADDIMEEGLGGTGEKFCLVSLDEGEYESGRKQEPSTLTGCRKCMLFRSSYLACSVVQNRSNWQDRGFQKVSCAFIRYFGRHSLE